MELLGRYSNPDDLWAKLQHLQGLPRGRRPEVPKHTKQGQIRLAPADVDRLTEARQHGTTVNQLAELFGVHRTTVLAHLNRADVEPRTGVVTRRLDAACELYQAGWSLARIGREFGVNAETVRRALRAAQVQICPRRGWSHS